MSVLARRRDFLRFLRTIPEPARKQVSACLDTRFAGRIDATLEPLRIANRIFQTDRLVLLFH